MPLRFLNPAAQVFFWIFLTLMAAAAICALCFAFRGKKMLSAAGCSAALLFLGLTMVCLIPSYPLVYIPCFLASFAAFGQAFDKLWVKCGSLMLFSVCEGLIVAKISLFYSFFTPALALCALLPPILALGTMGLMYLMRRRHLDEVGLWVSALVMRVVGLIFALILIIDKVHYAPMLLFAGYLYLLGGTAFPPREGVGFSRAFFRTGFFLLGSLLIILGLALSVGA